MRFMMIMLPGITQEQYEQFEAGPSAEDLAAMTAMSKYNDELAKAGALLALDGLAPPAKGARVSFQGGTPRVTDGPFAEAKELIGGYWLIQAKSKEEAVEWASRVPAREGDVIEVRQVQEREDFPPEVQAALQP